MNVSTMAKVFKALSCEQRLTIIKRLREWECVEACCDGVFKAFTRVAEETKVSRSTLSHHFKELENANLIICDRQGQSMCCKVNEKLISEVKDFLS